MPRKPRSSKRPAAGGAGRKDDDDSSVDSKGNIRNLIDYDYEESSEEGLFELEHIPKPPARTPRAPRAAAQAARNKLRKMAEEAAESPQSASPEPPAAAVAADDTSTAVVKKRRIVPTLITPKKEVSLPEEKGAPQKKHTFHALPESSDEEGEDEESSEEDVRRHSKQRKVARRLSYESNGEEEEEDDEDEEEYDSEEDSDYDEEDDDEEDDEDEEDDDEEEDEDDRRRRRKGGSTFDIIISDMIGGGAGQDRDPNKPRKYNLKKEPASVRRFVELVQKENEGEEDTIDNDITYFKSLPAEKQSNLLHVLELKASPVEVQIPLKFKILEKVVARPELNRIAMAKYNALCNLDPSSSEYYKCSHWITGFTGLPLGLYRDLPVKIEDGPEACFGFMEKVHKCMNSAIHGHEEAKLQIMQFVSSWIANPKANGNVLSIHGPPGVGKTSLIKDGVAKALDRPFHFITLGGATDASFLDGHSYTYEGSTWGKIVDVLIQSKCMNPVIYFDELDKVSETPKGDEIMNLLIHLTDGAQNDRFQDKYFTGIDLDLSRCLFIFSHNNIEKVNPILRDRMYNISVKGFSLKEKLLIAEEYLLPAALKEAGLHEKVSIGKEILQHVIENYTGGEGGVRELKRCIQTIVSKINLLRFYNNPKQVPFAIEGFALPFTLKKSHLELFLKRKEPLDQSVAHMYV